MKRIVWFKIIPVSQADLWKQIRCGQPCFSILKMTLISVRSVLPWEFDGSDCACSTSIFSNCFRPWAEYKLCEGRNHAYVGYSCMSLSVQFRSVAKSLFATPWTGAHQASLSVTSPWSLLKLMSIKSVTPFNHLILLNYIQ